MGQVGNYNYGGTNVMPGSCSNEVLQAVGTPLLGTSTAVLAATASVAASTVTAGITNPDVPRNVTATPGGTTANVLAVQVVVTGTNIEDLVITETLPAFTAGAGTAVTGVKAFKTVTSIALPITGAATTIAIGTGSKLGLIRRLLTNSVAYAVFGGTKEATAPTVVTSATLIEQNTAALNSALDGASLVDILIHDTHR